MTRKQEAKAWNSGLELAISRLKGLTNESQAAISSIINRLAEAEGVSNTANHKLPVKGIPQWLIKLRSERKSARTIKLYSYLAERILKQLPIH